MLRLPLDNWDGYIGMLRQNPVLVKACTSGIVYALGDWVAQTIEGTELSDIRRGRVLRSALAGLLLHGPLSHVWYGVCEGLFDAVGWNDYWYVGAVIIAVFVRERMRYVGGAKGCAMFLFRTKTAKIFRVETSDTHIRVVCWLVVPRCRSHK